MTAIDNRTFPMVTHRNDNQQSYEGYTLIMHQTIGNASFFYYQRLNFIGKFSKEGWENF